MSPVTRSGKPSEARTRLLGTATKIFYAEGIHSVGVDRIIEEAEVTRATLYRHFKGKEELVLAYLDLADQGIRAQITGAGRGRRSGGQRTGGRTGHHRGHPLPRLPRLRVPQRGGGVPRPGPSGAPGRAAHRQWFLETVTELLGRVGMEPADAAGRHFVMLRDGAMAAGCLFDPELVGETFLHGVESLLTAGGAASRA